MSFYVGVFVGVDGVGGVVSLVEWLVGHRFVLESGEFGDTYRAIAAGLEFSVFGDHGAEDNLGIEFSKYSIEVRIEALGGVDRRWADLAAKAVGVMLGAEISRRLSCRSMVVYDVQELAIRFDCGREVR